VCYYDVKTENILYFCRKDKEIDISLADMGSIIPNKGNYIATYPPPHYFKGYMKKLPERFQQSYYTWLLITLFIQLVTNITPPKYQDTWIKYNIAYNKSITDSYKVLTELAPDDNIINIMIRDLHKGAHYVTDLLPPIEEFLELLPQCKVL